MRRSAPRSPIERRSRPAARSPRSFSAAGRPPLCVRRRCRASSTPSPPNGGSRPGAEITLEANPNSVEAGRFRAYRAAGVNRLSVGVQALNDADLRALGRKHTADEALAAVDLAASLFPRFTFDLIYGRPGQSEAQWRAELARALDLVGDHVSLYQLTIEPDTIFERLRDAGKLALPDEELGLSMFTATRELTEARGLPAYEVSNHARSGAESRHNLIYWRYGEYAGVGPGAHGRIVTPKGRLAQETEPHPEMWLTQVETEGHGLVESAPLSREEQGDEFLLMGLNSAKGSTRAATRRLADGSSTASGSRALSRMGSSSVTRAAASRSPGSARPSWTRSSPTSRRERHFCTAPDQILSKPNRKPNQADLADQEKTIGSLDFFVGIGAFQWVMGDPKRKMKAASWAAAPAWRPVRAIPCRHRRFAFCALPGPIGKTFR